MLTENPNNKKNQLELEKIILWEKSCTGEAPTSKIPSLMSRSPYFKEAGKTEEASN